MKKLFLSILIGCTIFFSCTYKYNSLDLSNYRPAYSVYIPDSTEKEWSRIALKDYKPVLSKYKSAKWSRCVEECDKDDNVLYKGKARGEAEHNTTYINVYDTFFVVTEEPVASIPRCIFKYKSDELPISPARSNIRITPSDSYTIEPLGKDLIQYEYWLQCSSEKMSELLTDMGYGYINADHNTYNLELDSNGNVLTQKQQKEVSWSHAGTSTVVSCIDVYGKKKSDGSDYGKIIEVRFPPIKITDLDKKHIQLTDANNPTITTFVNYTRYWLEFSCSEISAKLSELGYKISDSDYYIIERDEQGNILRNITKPKSSSTDKWMWSAENAYSVQACIDVSGWKVDSKGNVNYSTETKVFTVLFDQLLLDDIKNKQTELTAAAPHTYNIYVQGDNDIHVTGVSLNKTSTTIQVGFATTLTATITPSNATNKSVTWTSSNTSVATVSSTGKVSGKSAGTATITCKTNDGGYTAICIVTVTGSGGGSSSTTTLWNFSDAAFNSLGTITSSKTVNGLTIAATSSKNVVIDSHNVSYDGLAFTNRLKFGGTGASNARNVSFTVTGACTIEIYACSANSSENRTLKVDFGSFGSTNTSSYSLSGNVSKVTAIYTASTSKKVYIYSANSGINIYAIRVTY